MVWPRHSGQSEESAFDWHFGKAGPPGRSINSALGMTDGEKFFGNMVKLEGVMRKAKWNIFILTAALALTFLATPATAAPNPGKQPQNEQAEKMQPPPNSTVYRVSYRVNELENGKTINSRSYTLMAQPSRTMSVRIGNRVPFTTANSAGKGAVSSVQYWNVGMNIDSTIDDRGENLLVHTKLEMNSLAAKEQQSALEHPPIFNDLRLDDTTSATLGKPAFVGSLDDVSSNRHYVIEVTVTKAK